MDEHHTARRQHRDSEDAHLYSTVVAARKKGFSAYWAWSGMIVDETYTILCASL